jgi:hypothetical protein
METSRRRLLLVAVFVGFLVVVLGVVGYFGYRWWRYGPPDLFAAGPRPTAQATSRTPPPTRLVLPAAPTAEAMHLRNVGQLALSYETANQAAPENLQALQAWAVDSAGARASDFRSPRDGKPYDFRMEATGPVVAEHTGRNGHRYVYAPKKDGSARVMEEETPAANREPARAPKPEPKGKPDGATKKPKG